MKQHYWCQAIFDARTALKAQLPVYGNCGFLDLPNLLIEGIYLLEIELEDAKHRRTS